MSKSNEEILQEFYDGQLEKEIVLGIIPEYKNAPEWMKNEISKSFVFRRHIASVRLSEIGTEVIKSFNNSMPNYLKRWFIGS
jgi:hypothetical protein